MRLSMVMMSVLLMSITPGCAKERRDDDVGQSATGVRTTDSASWSDTIRASFLAAERNDALL
jgi:hypothetical protein